jgi:hypothetical protein
MQHLSCQSTSIPGVVAYQDLFTSTWTDPAQVDPDGLRCGFEMTEYGRYSWFRDD